MDLILKGKIVDDAKVLDVGCGEGRNGIFFIRNGYEYQGWDKDASKLKLLEYLTRSLRSHRASFEVQDLQSSESSETFDFIICSRVLHFASSHQEFLTMWQKLRSLLRSGGIIYASMDSAVDNTLAKSLGDGRVEFPDTKVRFALTDEGYEAIKKGFEEVEPLRTVAHHNERAQSFLVFRKT